MNKRNQMRFVIGYDEIGFSNIENEKVSNFGFRKHFTPGLRHSFPLNTFSWSLLMQRFKILAHDQ